MTELPPMLGEIVDLSAEAGAITVEIMATDDGELTLVLWKARRFDGGGYKPTGPVLSIALADVPAVFYAVARVHEAAGRAEEAGTLSLDPYD